MHQIKLINKILEKQHKLLSLLEYQYISPLQ